MKARVRRQPRNEMSITTSPIQDFLTRLHQDCAADRDGQVAIYIPELAKADPDWFGICLATAGGAVYEVGDTRQEFTIQSISKPFVYGLALEDNGRAAVLERVGVEPTGDAFNSISLDPVTGRPRNPMINAGAIATAGLIAGATPAGRFRRILETFSLYAGRSLVVDECVYRSESQTGFRNRAIGHMLRNFNKLTGDPMLTTELYFQQCSISVNCRDLGIMAATLANRGVNPLTGRQALRGEYVESVLSVMGTCGMYDYAGEWLYSKSGVAGGVLAVLPGQLGIGVFSPRLDAHGNSVRGVRVCRELSRYLDLHLFNRPAVGRLGIRRKFTGAEFSSSQVRRIQEDRILRDSGNAIQVYQLQGNLGFAAAEPLVRDVLEHLAGMAFLVLDLRRVLSLDESASHLLCSLFVKLRAAKKKMMFVQNGHLPLLRRMMKSRLGEKFDRQFQSFDNRDQALEWCENDLLNKCAGQGLPRRPVRIADYQLLRGLTAGELAVVRPLLKRRSFARSEKIIRAGTEARELFFLSRGVVGVYLPGAEPQRVASVSPGMCFGEMAFIDGEPRSADIVAESDVDCHSMALNDFVALGETRPALKIKLLEQLCLDLTRKLRKADCARDALD
jgi:glutaminase